MKDALTLQTVEGLCAVPGFIDNYIITKIPPEGEDDELQSLVMRLQRHKHTCQKMVDKGVGLIIPNNLILKHVSKQMQIVETRLGFISSNVTLSHLRSKESRGLHI